LIARRVHGEQDQLADLVVAIRCAVSCAICFEGLVEGGDGGGGWLMRRFGIQAEQRLKSAGGTGAPMRIGILEATSQH
jgi:hypothetical protein